MMLAVMFRPILCIISGISGRWTCADYSVGTTTRTVYQFSYVESQKKGLASTVTVLQMNSSVRTMLF